MAEVYAFLLTRPKLVVKRTQKDVALQNKVALLKRHLKWFSPQLDEQFWKSAAAPRGTAIAKVAAPPAPKPSK